VTLRPRLRHALTATALASVAACGETNFTPASQLTFDGPVDIAFACYGGLRLTGGGAATVDHEIIATAQPVEACNIRSLPHAADAPQPVPPGQESLVEQGGLPVPGASWYGFILQSTPGTVSLAEFPTKPSTAFAGGDVVVLDADPLTPGKNGISVGEEPVAIVGDRSGCWQLIANAGSCDMSALEVNTAVARVFGDIDTQINVQRLTVKNASGTPIDARPAAMAINANGAVIGEACPATPIGIAYLAYPSCNLVAAVDVSTATIVGGIRYDDSGASIVPEAELATLSCPSECASGGVIPSGTRPVTLDLEVGPVRGIEQERLLIGADNSNVVTLVEIDEVTHLPASVHPIPLEDPSGVLGVTHVALAPEIGMGGSDGTINDEIASGGRFNFAYAVATDDTVRVIALNGAVENGGPAIDLVECDTQVDPRLIYDLRNVRALSCFPVGRPGTPARRPGATGPGIELPGDALPTSIDIFRSPEFSADVANPTKLVGYFGIITATNGATFVLNVDDDDYPDFEIVGAPLQAAMPLAIAHQLRDGIPGRHLVAEEELTVDEQTMTVPDCDNFGPDPDGVGGNAGGPRATTNPSRNTGTGQIAAEKAGQLPSLRQLLCSGNNDTRTVSELVFAAPAEVREQVYPDLRALEDENWSLTWEGSLSLDASNAAVDGPPIRVSQIRVDGTGMRIFDDSAPFCDAGVEPHDIVQLTGCDPALGDAECPIGYTCYVHANSQVPGLGACMLVDEADRLANACKDFLTSRRRYTVARADSGQLRLLPRKHVLRTTPVDGCVDDAQCEALGDYELQLTSGAHPRNDTTGEDPRRWVCAVDPDRAPLDGPGQTGKRCLQACTDTSECTAGTVCQAGYCMEGVIPPQACVNAPQRYQLRAGEAFAVVGSRTGYLHPIIEDPATGQCITDPNAHPFETGRIPLTAPPCDPAADPLTGRLPDGSFAPNPCSLTVDHTETVRAYADLNTCTAANPSTRIETRQAPAIQFRNRGLTLTLVDPVYPGDATCLGDRMGNLGNIPSVFPGYQLAWRQTGGFTPQLLAIDPAFPVKVVRGPTQSIWVLDEGDYLAPPGSLDPSTRGRVYRIEPQAIGRINRLQ